MSEQEQVATDKHACACIKPEPWRSEKIDLLCAALAKAQKIIEQPKKTKTAKVRSKKGDEASYSYTYADIGDVVAAINKVAPDCGLSHSQILQPHPTEEGRMLIITMVMHESGQWLTSTYRLPIAESNHEMGGNITYGRRYALAPMFGIAAEEDTDFNGSHKGGGTEIDPEEEKRLAEAAAKSKEAIENLKKRSKKVDCKPDPDAAKFASTSAEPTGDAARAEAAAGGTSTTAKPEAAAAPQEPASDAPNNTPDDYTGINPRLAAKLQEFPAGSCPLSAFKSYAIKAKHFKAGMDFTKLPEDYIQQIMDNWAKVEPKFRLELLPF